MSYRNRVVQRPALTIRTGNAVTFGRVECHGGGKRQQKCRGSLSALVRNGSPLGPVLVEMFAHSNDRALLLLENL